eukprot:1157533-Pelagomonas_calceolata.AAC.1
MEHTHAPGLTLFSLLPRADLLLRSFAIFGLLLGVDFWGSDGGRAGAPRTSAQHRCAWDLCAAQAQSHVHTQKSRWILDVEQV